MIRITHQRKKCIGCNACVEMNRNRWRISRLDGKCTLIGGKLKNGFYIAIVPLDEWKLNALAAKNCPVKIIRLEKIS